MTVAELDTETPPPLEQFTLDLPAEVQVNRAGAPEWINLKAPETVAIQDLAALHERCIAHGKEMAARDARLEANAQAAQANRSPTIADSFSMRTLIILANLVLIPLVIGVVWWRRKSS